MLGYTDTRTRTLKDRQTSAGLLLSSNPPEETFSIMISMLSIIAYMLNDFEYISIVLGCCPHRIAGCDSLRWIMEPGDQRAPEMFCTVRLRSSMLPALRSDGERRRNTWHITCPKSPMWLTAVHNGVWKSDRNDNSLFIIGAVWYLRGQDIERDGEIHLTLHMTVEYCICMCDTISENEFCQSIPNGKKWLGRYGSAEVRSCAHALIRAEKTVICIIY